MNKINTVVELYNYSRTFRTYFQFFLDAKKNRDFDKTWHYYLILSSIFEVYLEESIISADLVCYIDGLFFHNVVFSV